MAKESKEDDVFELGQDTPVEEPFVYDEEATNLVSEFKKHVEGRAAIKRLVMKCLNDFDDAWRATEAYRTNMADIWKLFSGTLDPKGGVFAHMSAAHVPLLMENTLRMVTRQAYELFGNWTNVFGVTPLGPDDEGLAKLLSLHGNWQIRKRIKDFKRQLGHRGLLIFNLYGDVSVHSYWDSERRTNRHEVLTPNELVTANAHVSTMPDYSDVPWLAKIIFMSAHEMRKMDGAWEDVATALKRMPPEWDDGELEQKLREAVDRTMGVDSSAFDSGQYRVIQYEGWLNLPGQRRDRYCKVVIDQLSRTMLALAIHERIDPYDKRRYEFQIGELERYKAGLEEVQAFLQEREATKIAALEAGHSMDPESGGPEESVVMARAIEEMQPPPEPPMPEWMGGDPNAVPEEPAYVPIRMFAHGVNIEPLVGVLGLGTGYIHSPQNKIANVALQMFIDQGTFGNTKNILTRGDLRLPKKLVLEPGKIHVVEGASDLSKDIMPLDFGPANPQLLTLIETLMRYANSVSNTPEVLAGEAGKSGETAQGISARIEQATKMLTVPTGKYADLLTQVLENNAILNATFLPDSEFFSVNNHDPKLGAIGRQIFNVGRQMYDRPYDVEISADLKFTSTAQRISEADALVQMPNAVQELAGNFAFKHAVISKSLEARNRYDLVSLLGAPPAAPQVFGVPTSPPMPPPGAVPAPAAPGGQAPPGGQQQKPQEPQGAR